MNDPYKTLGVEPSASDEEVKRAYRDLARKYHPDRFPDDSAKELAEEKMKEINEAYDQIQKMRQAGASGGSYGGGYAGGNSGGQTYSGGGVYGRIRQYIQMGNLAQAEQLLNSVPDKTAEWYFLYGALCQRKGWFDEAQRNFQTACNMDPSNAEYRQAATMMRSGGGMYRGGTDNGGLNGCGCCSDLLCADCCCECMGGDLIPCC